MPISSTTEFPYHRDSTYLFEIIRHLEWPIFLDSTESEHLQSRYDILTAQPDIRITTQQSNTLVEQSNQSNPAIYTALYESGSDPLSIIETEFNRWKIQLAPISTATSSTLGKPNVDLAILPGLYGYLGYDLGRRFENIPQFAQRDITLPDLACGFYSWIILVDHHRKHSHLVITSPNPDTDYLLDLLTGHTSEQAKAQALRQKHCQQKPFNLTQKWVSNLPKPQYTEAFRKTMAYINQGDCYQINLSHRLSNEFEGDPWHAYKKLRRCNPNPFAAYFDLGSHQILSLSPEQFIQIKGDRAQTRPIKGTAPRSNHPTTDTQLAEQLSRSEKNRAENLMIVDLLRNDFSKHCLLNSVKVPALFELESFPTVHHLVSTVVGQLAKDRSPLQLIRSCFPGGSITGAPKIRAMEIIDELEPQRRSIYCGSILYLDIAGRLDSNITIRTLLCHDNKIYCWAGGGIVADSECEPEYQETFDKVSGILKGLE